MKLKSKLEAKRNPSVGTNELPSLFLTVNCTRKTVEQNYLEPTPLHSQQNF